MRINVDTWASRLRNDNPSQVLVFVRRSPVRNGVRPFRPSCGLWRTGLGGTATLPGPLFVLFVADGGDFLISLYRCDVGTYPVSLSGRVWRTTTGFASCES